MLKKGSEPARLSSFRPALETSLVHSFLVRGTSPSFVTATFRDATAGRRRQALSGFQVARFKTKRSHVVFCNGITHSCTKEAAGSVTVSQKETFR